MVTTPTTTTTIPTTTVTTTTTTTTTTRVPTTTRRRRINRLSGLLVPNNRGKRDTHSRHARFSVPLLKSKKETQAVIDGNSGTLVNDGAYAESEPEAEAEAEAEPEAEAEHAAEPLSGKSPFVPRAEFHAMDCTDIVVGSARGDVYRINDYYTRDRSTPRRDEFYGGVDSITAALGWEVDGVTTILFRRKLEADHPTDHPITDSLMHVIWAVGQEEGSYIHSPKSGLESGNPSIQDFYRPDELKYHGQRDQRGVVSLNFMEKSTNLKSSGEDNINWCGGHWKYPGSCSIGKDCDYYAKWEYFEDTDDVQFTVQTKHIDRWTGIGFSDNTRMSLTDAVIGWVERSGRYFMFDAWVRGYTPPIVDPNQGVRNESGKIVDGLATISFVRRRISNDKEYDVSFTDDACMYLVFPVKGGVINYVSKKIRKHDSVPVVSTERVCIRSCLKYGGADGKPFVYTTTPRPPQLHYNVQVKLTGLGDNFKVPEKGTTAWNQLSERIHRSVDGAIQKIPGYEATAVKDVKVDGQGKLLAIMQVILNKDIHEAEVGEVPVPEGETSEAVNSSMVEKVLQESVNSGTIGTLRVDPSFLRVNQLREVSESVREETVTGLEGDNRNPALKFLEVNKMWIIIGVVGFLLVLTIIQAIVTISRIKKNRSPPVSTKERLITNSGWKDYSQGNMNYAYESFETEENGVNSRRQGHNGTLRPNGNHGSYGRTNGHASGGYNGSMNGHMSHPGGYGGDTRSLQRPRNAPQVRPDPRGTYSLPRGSTTSSLPSYNTAMQEMTPDFYYLPSQRKYSGEVVRVYVDYNQSK